MPVGVDPNVAKHRIPVPDGLRSLLESLAREVLRGQPTDIYTFCSIFFDKLNEFRKNHNGLNPLDNPELYDKFKLELFTEAADKQLVSSKLIVSSSNRGLKTDDSKLKQTKQDEHQEGPSAGVRKKHVTINDPNIAATKIQATARGFLDRRRLSHTKEALDAARKERVIQEHAYSPTRTPRKGKKRKRPASAPTKPEESEADKAATKIQAGIRGYLTRKHYIETKQKRDKAATKIQAGIKGHLTRKHLEAQGIPIHRVRSQSPNVLEHHEADQHKILEEINAASIHKDIDETVTGEILAESHKKDVQVDEAAAKIQAGIRGYLTRKHMEDKGLPVHHPTRHGSVSPVPGKVVTHPLEKQQQPLTPTTPEHEHAHHHITTDNPDVAAAKIQAGVRGYLTRKHLNEKGVPVHAPAHHHHNEHKHKSPSPPKTPQTSKIPMRRSGKTKQGSPP